MILRFSGSTATHVRFAVLYKGDGWEYTPSIAVGSFAIVPADIQAPILLPGNTNIGGYTTPSQGLQLDYVEYTPLAPSIDKPQDLIDLLDFETFIQALLSGNIIAYYIVRGDARETQPTYPHTYTDDRGDTHLIPDGFGSGGIGYYLWLASNEYNEGMVVNLDLVGLLLACDNDTSIYQDGRYLCLEGGGIYPLIPRFCEYPDSFSDITNFAISTLDTWNEEWDGGFGNTALERTQLIYPDSQGVGDFAITNTRNAVAAWPFYGSGAICDEFVEVLAYRWDGLTPGNPRIVAPEPLPPTDLPGIPTTILHYSPIGILGVKDTLDIVELDGDTVELDNEEVSLL